MGEPLERREHLDLLKSALDRYPVVAILGARQVGKTTIARNLAAEEAGSATFFDLEDPEDRARLTQPKLALQGLRGLVVLDEIQLVPDLFAVLRVLADRPDRPARFLVLGSASPDLLQQSESLAGRIHFHRLGGFALDEVGRENWRDLWIRGGFPRSYLAGSDEESAEWRRDFIDTFLERDLPQLGIQIRSATLRRFWTMIAHYHGQTWNGSELGRAFGVSHTTVGRYLELLTSTYVLRKLQPWHENLGKRQVRSPKVYVADSGVMHTLLNVEDHHDLLGHPKRGASWEGFVINELIHRLGARSDECHFWATHAGAELDLLIVRGRRRRGFEVKLSTSPKVTTSMRTALENLRLDRLDVIHAGEHSFPMDERIHAVSLPRIDTDVPGLRELEPG